MVLDNNKREQAIELMGRGREQRLAGRLRTAYKTLNEARDLTRNDSSLVNIDDMIANELSTIQSGAYEQVNKARQWIDAALNNEPSAERILAGLNSDEKVADAFAEEVYNEVGYFMVNWRKDVDAQLERWDEALIGGDDPDLEETRTRLARFVPALQRQLYYSAIEAECQRLWARPNELLAADQRVAPSFILGIVTKARDIAQYALGKYERSTDFQVLADRAATVREQQAGAVQIFTSAVQGDYYAQELERLNTLPEDNQVPIYDFVNDSETGQQKEVLQGYVSVSEAKVTLQRMAKQWAKGLSDDYYGQAEEALDNYNPAMALEVLENRGKIEQFLEPADRQDLDELAQRARDAKVQWDKATELANSISDYQHAPLTAWKIYNDAMAIYPASAVKAVYSTVMSYILDDLRARDERIQQARDAHDIATAQRIHESTERDYGRIDEQRVQAALDAIKRVYEYTDSFHREFLEAISELERIQRLLRDDPAQAVADLKTFKATHVDKLALLDNFAAIEQRVLEHSSAADKLETLQDTMRSDSIRDVERAIKSAQQAQKTYPDDDRFYDVESDLQGHLAFLEGKRAYDTLEDYEQARNFFVKVGPNHPDNHQAERYLDLIQEKLDNVEDLNDRIRYADSLLNDNKSIEAYRELRGIKPVTDVQRSEHRTLSRRAQRDAQRALVRQIEIAHTASEAWNPETDTSVQDVQSRVTEIGKVLDAMGELGFSELEKQWRGTTRTVMTAQQAWLLTAGSSVALKDYSRAMEMWRDAIQGADDNNQRAMANIYTGQLRRVRRGYLRVRLQDLRRQSGQQATSDASKAINAVDDAVRRSEEEFNAYLEDYADDPLVMLWQAEAYGIGGRFSADPKRREQYFTQMQAMADTVRNNLDAKKYHQDAERLYAEAREGLTFSEVMQRVEDNLKEDKLESLVAVGRDYRTHIQNAESALVRSWWITTRDTYLNKIKTDVGEEGTPIELEELLTLAKIVTIDPEHNRARTMLNNFEGMWQKLSRKVMLLLDGLSTAQDVPGPNGQERLYRQITEASNYRAYLEVMVYIPNLFNEVNRNISGAASQQLSRLQKALESLNRLREISEDTAKALEREKKESKFTDTLDQLARVPHEFEDHPAIVELRNRVNSLQRGAAHWRDLMQQVAKAVQDEDYPNALAVFRQISEASLKNGGLLDAFTVRDPITGFELTSYDKVGSMLERREKALLKVQVYVRPLTMMGERDGLRELPVPPTVKSPLRDVMSWTERKQEIENAIVVGNFPGAVTLATSTLDNPAELTMPFRIALEELRNAIPVVDPITQEEAQSASTLRERLQVAIKKAGTTQGQQMLQTVLDVYVPHMENAIREIEGLVQDPAAGRVSDDNIHLRKESFEAAFNRVRGDLAGMAAAITEYQEASGFFGQNARKRAVDDLTSAHASYEQNLKDAKAICPEHPELRKIERQYTVTQARDIMRG